MHGGVVSRLGKSFWRLPIPEKAKFFFWPSYHDKVLTRENLLKRRVNVAANCPFCDENEESLNHVMLQCPFSKAYWQIIFSSVDIPDLPSSFTDVWESWSLSPQIKTRFPVLECLFLTSAWCLRKERNSKIFRFFAIMPQAVAKIAIYTFSDWPSIASHPNIKILLSRLTNIPHQRAEGWQHTTRDHGWGAVGDCIGEIWKIPKLRLTLHILQAFIIQVPILHMGFMEALSTTFSGHALKEF